MSFVVVGVKDIFAFVGVVGGAKPIVVVCAVGRPKGMHTERRKEHIVKRQKDDKSTVKPRDDGECEQGKKPWLIGVQQESLQDIKCHYQLVG